MVEKRNKNSLRVLLNPVTLVTTFILLFGMVAVGLVALFLGKEPLLSASVTPHVTKIAAPTFTPQPTDQTSNPSRTPTTGIFLPDGVIGVGAYVQVIGTEGAGLRMRSEPGLNNEVNFTALDSEVFLVIEGPVEADGYTWWRLEAPYDKTRSGWSVNDFLSPIEEGSD